MEPSLVMFAIESVVRLGTKIDDVLVDETVEAPLLLPVGTLYGSVEENEAEDFFSLPENRHLIRAGGPYHGFASDELLAAYRSLLAIDERMGRVGGERVTAAEVVTRLERFRQLRSGMGANTPAQRILGTVLEIGIDYFSAHPEALGKDSGGRRIAHAFLRHLDQTDFAEGASERIAGDVLGAALRTLGDDVTLADDDERVQVLLGGVVDALLADFAKADTEGKKRVRQDLIRRIASSVLRGGAAAFSERIELFLPAGATGTSLVSSTLTQVLVGIEGKEQLFSNESLEVVFRAALTAVGENAAAFGDDVVVQQLIARTVTAVTSASGSRLFAPETAAAVVAAALDVAAENVETLIDPTNPERQLLANAVGALAKGMGAQLAGGGTVRELLSKAQVVELTRIVFDEVADHPELLLGDDPTDERKTALAQVVGSVARALGDDPSRLVRGAGLVELVRIAIRCTIRNADLLVDVGTPGTRNNVLCRILTQVVAAVDATADPRRLVSRTVFIEVVQQVLPVVSDNLEVLMETDEPLVERTVQRALELASGALAGRVTGNNLPLLVAELLLEVLWEELDLTEPNAVELAALQILRAA